LTATARKCFLFRSVETPNTSTCRLPFTTAAAAASAFLASLASLAALALVDFSTFAGLTALGASATAGISAASASPSWSALFFPFLSFLWPSSRMSFLPRKDCPCSFSMAVRASASSALQKVTVCHVCSLTTEGRKFDLQLHETETLANTVRHSYRCILQWSNLFKERREILRIAQCKVSKSACKDVCAASSVPHWSHQTGDCAQILASHSQELQRHS
jgi:hypothetical protein